MNRGIEVFVRGVPWTFSKVELAKYCSQFGPVVKAYVSFDRETGMNTGIGFVNFQSKDAVAKVNSHSMHFAEGSTMQFDARSRRERLGVGPQDSEEQ